MSDFDKDLDAMFADSPEADLEPAGTYRDYLRSPEWHELRQRVTFRERGLCQGCQTNIGRHGHVHHITYAHIGAELLCDLVLLCRGCHEKAHDKGTVSEWRKLLRRVDRHGSVT